MAMSIISIVMVIIVSYIEGASRKFHLWRYGKERRICFGINLGSHSELRNIKVATRVLIYMSLMS